MMNERFERMERGKVERDGNGVKNRHCGWEQGTVKQRMRKMRNKRERV